MEDLFFSMDPDEDCFDDPVELETSIPMTLYAPTPHPHPDALLEEASRISPAEWEAKYKKAAAEAYRDGLAILRENIYDATQWQLWDKQNHQIFQRLVRDPEDRFTMRFPYIFRVHAVVKGKPERYIWVIKDHDKDTRLAWDHQDVASVQQMETYRTDQGDIDVVKCEIKNLGVLVSNRLLLGVQTTSYNPEERTHIYAYQTAEHYYFSKHFNSAKVVLVPKCVVFVHLTPFDDGTCSLKMLVGIDPGKNAWMIKSDYPSKLRERVVLWERVVQNWKLYYPLDPKLVENRK